MKKSLMCEPRRHAYRESTNGQSIYCPKCGDVQSLVAEPCTHSYWPAPYTVPYVVPCTRPHAPYYYTWTVGSGTADVFGDSTMTYTTGITSGVID